MARRIIIEEGKCFHGASTEHLVVPSNLASVCPGPPRTILTDVPDEMVERAALVWFRLEDPDDVYEWGMDLVRAALTAALFPEEAESQ